MNPRHVPYTEEDRAVFDIPLQTIVDAEIWDSLFFLKLYQKAGYINPKEYTSLKQIEIYRFIYGTRDTANILTLPLEHIFHDTSFRVALPLRLLDSSVDVRVYLIYQKRYVRKNMIIYKKYDTTSFTNRADFHIIKEPQPLKDEYHYECFGPTPHANIRMNKTRYFFKKLFH